jgi:hypothetical protein
VWGSGEDHKTNTIKTHDLKRLDYVNFIKCSILNGEHNWEDLCIQLRNQQICIFVNHNRIMGGPIFALILANASL